MQKENVAMMTFGEAVYMVVGLEGGDEVEEEGVGVGVDVEVEELIENLFEV